MQPAAKVELPRLQETPLYIAWVRRRRLKRQFQLAVGCLLVLTLIGVAMVAREWVGTGVEQQQGKEWEKEEVEVEENVKEAAPQVAVGKETGVREDLVVQGAEEEVGEASADDAPGGQGLEVIFVSELIALKMSLEALLQRESIKLDPLQFVMVIVSCFALSGFMWGICWRLLARPPQVPSEKRDVETQTVWDEEPTHLESHGKPVSEDYRGDTHDPVKTSEWMEQQENAPESAPEAYSEAGSEYKETGLYAEGSVKNESKICASETRGKVEAEYQVVESPAHHDEDEKSEERGCTSDSPVHTRSRECSGLLKLPQDPSVGEQLDDVDPIDTPMHRQSTSGESSSEDSSGRWMVRRSRGGDSLSEHSLRTESIDGLLSDDESLDGQVLGRDSMSGYLLGEGSMSGHSIGEEMGGGRLGGGQGRGGRPRGGRARGGRSRGVVKPCPRAGQRGGRGGAGTKVRQRVLAVNPEIVNSFDNGIGKNELQNREICKRWLAGNCEYGSRCFFRHDQDFNHFD